ncbi:unnamed protein product [Effrenium voratum]|nr:unnamed protein product [Effrenium voratum]
MSAWTPWGVPVFQQRAAPPPGDIILMPVLHLRFTHDKIRPVFRKGRHRGQPIYELVNDLVKGVVNPLVNLPPLEIYLHKGVWRSLNNRRLWALKAYMGLSGNFQLLVRVCISSRSAAAFREKNSTHTDGLSVEVTGDETALKERLSTTSLPNSATTGGMANASAAIAVLLNTKTPASARRLRTSIILLQQGACSRRFTRSAAVLHPHRGRWKSRPGTLSGA